MVELKHSTTKVGEKFRSRSLKFPGLVSGCTMDWFEKWPKDALVAVSKHFLSNFQLVCTEQVKDSIINSMGNFQVLVEAFVGCCLNAFE